MWSFFRGRPDAPSAATPNPCTRSDDPRCTIAIAPRGPPRHFHELPERAVERGIRGAGRPRVRGDGPPERKSGSRHDRDEKPARADGLAWERPTRHAWLCHAARAFV
jgi:hypothetical protein